MVLEQRNFVSKFPTSGGRNTHPVITVSLTVAINTGIINVDTEIVLYRADVKEVEKTQKRTTVVIDTPTPKP